MAKSFFAGLRVRLILLVLIAIIPALGLIVYSAMEERRQEAEHAKKEALRLTQLAAGNFGQFIEGARQMLIALSHASIIRNREAAACNKRFAAMIKQYKNYLSIGAADPAGNLFSSSLVFKKPLKVADRKWFQLTLQTRNFAVGDFQFSRITGNPTIVFGYPVFDERGAVAALLYSAADLGWFNQLAKDARMPPGATLIIIDRRGTIIARYPDPQQWTGKILPETNLVKTILAQKEGLEEVTGIDGIKRLYGFTPIHGAVDTGLYLSIGISKEIAFKKVDRTLYRNLAILGLAAALALIIAWIAGNRLILHRVKALLEATKHLRNGDLSARTGLPHQDGEISQLARAFDEMAEALEQREADHEWAEARIRQLNRLLRTISEINQLIVRENNREQVLSETCKILVEHGEFKMAWIGMADFKTGQVIPVAHAGSEEAYLQEIQVRCDDTPEGHGPTGTALREQSTILCNDIENDLSFAPWREVAGKYGYRSSAALPLRVGNAAIGILSIYAGQKNAFGKEEKDLLEELAGDIGYALKNFAEVEARKQAEREREITVELLRLANESRSTRELIREAVTFFRQQAGCEAVGVRLREGEDYPYFEVHGFPPEFVQLENQLCTRNPDGQIIRDRAGNPVIECMCGNVICGRFDPAKPFFTAHGSFWTNNTTALLASTTEADRQVRTRNRCNGEGYESVALLPLRVGEERLGLLQLNDRRKNMFTAETIALWERLAGYLAVALAKLQVEEEINQRNRELSVLYTIDRAIAQTLKLEEVLRSAVGATLEVLKLDAGCIYLLEADGKTMSIHAHSGYSQDFIGKVQYIKLGEGISGRAAAERKPVITDIAHYPTPRLLSYLVNEKLQSIISTPLISGGQLLGAFNMSSRRPRAFPPEEIELLAAIGSLLGGAVQNARLYEAAQLELTEREQAQEELQESEKRYKKLLETVTNYIYTVKVEGGRVVSTSHGPGCTAVTGYTAEDYETDPSLWLRMVHEEDRATVMEQSAKIMAGEWAPPIEHRIIHKDGSVRWVRNTPVRHFDEQKRLIAYDGLISDITERKQAEEEIRLKAQLLDNANDSILLHDFDGNFIYFNETAYKSRGYKKDELMAMNLRNLVSPQHSDLYSSRVQELKEKGEIYFESEHLCKDGTLMPIEVNARLMESGGKKLILSIIRDVSERRQAEEVLRRYTERFSKAFRANPLAVGIITMEEGRILDVNDSWMRLLGYTREEIIGRTIVELSIWAAPDKRLKILQQLREEKSIRERELTIRTKSGEMRQGLGSFELIELSGETCILAMFHDLTDRKRLEAQLLQSQKIEAVGTLAGGVAHDFNNLLTAMMGNLELAKFKIDKGQPLETHLEEIENIVQRAAVLTQQLLAFSRRQLLQPVPLNLNETITSVSKMLSRLIGEHIELNLQLEANLGAVKADPAQLEQVIMNLCVNARDAMPTGGKLILKTQNVSLDEKYITNHPWVQAGDYVLLEVIDTGVGMDQATQERIFEPFFTTKEVGKGTGLGLSTVYGIIKQHQGYIDVYSEPGYGTTFKIYLPRTEERITKEEVEEAPKKVEGGRETILLAEDEEPLREAISNILEIFGYTVLAARDGREAVEVYEKQKEQIDLVILDAVMPKMGGKEVAERIYQLNPRQKILFTSGYSAEGLHETYIIPEDMHFIQKPYTAKALAQKIREVLEA